VYLYGDILYICIYVYIYRSSPQRALTCQQLEDLSLGNSKFDPIESELRRSHTLKHLRFHDEDLSLENSKFDHIKSEIRRSHTVKHLRFHDENHDRGEEPMMQYMCVYVHNCKCRRVYTYIQTYRYMRTYISLYTCIYGYSIYI
jgi:hypothetical protein